MKRIVGYIPIIWGTVFILFYFAGSSCHFLLLSALNGLCYSIFEPASKKILSTQTPPENRLLVFNLRYAAINLGAFVGPLLSLLFNMKMTLLPYVFLGILYILYGISTRFFFRDLPGIEASAPQKAKYSPHVFKLLLQDHVFLLLLAGMSFSFFGYSQLNATVSQYLANTSSLTNGIQLYSTLLSANALIILIVQFAMLHWISNWNPFNVVLLSNILISISFLSFLFHTSYIVPLIFILLFSLGELLIGARFDTLVDELASESAKGLYFGCSEFVKIGTIEGPILGTFLLNQFGFQSGFSIFGLICLICIIGSGLISLSKFKHQRNIFNK
ncbi:MFS transporter [Paenibacillus sp. P32E]|uniref:MFS transporter n=1 Tax=Paenibacillus sp. P32E TaxID=1349434 RepID=UPI00093DE7C8|nr:MFS transporter [Paenibacillus sp. P32E]OKP88695.1 hypothetical protein A3848_17170 [Paenibacillus sp. P32E]